ncbi:cytochrome c biogenesis heme-transporting ATPase CcmA [Paraglaciecola psychrophila]|uniref:Heme exporter protein CcmA n=1 Tax=Paraglaciecola psychrophila 170 TaxID=1129794 RepID=K6YT84_9ALTE|nr:cytochrome c biogenesis heme-transporting ATPase CcmA [Paraglaciecola psychrophila]AGH43717.1 heme exporter protein CcmA [Paraglaciecola psychrophila 170]GAC35929.1 heme exporter protein A [Paraglaciecola psychrophila 170]
MAVLSVTDLSVIKRDRLLFENLNFAVEQGSLLYVKGQNGAGKTSMLRVLAGLVDADCGDVYFSQQNIKDCREKYHLNLVYFGHKLGINLTLSAVENLEYWCRQHQVAIGVDTIFDTLAQLNLVGLEEIPVANLSAGQQRRVALARFWFKQDAKVWILDEPFTALDTQGIELLSKQITTFLSAGGAVVMTSHQALRIDYPTDELTLEYRI